jgi:hypothetical protein
MSNFLAIATVTAGLVQILDSVKDDVPGAKVTTVRPDGSGNGTPNVGVNLYLFQVTPNVAFRNADLPTRNSNGDLVQLPRAALDLHYLLTFYGNENNFEPQRLLGSVVRTLHARPVLTREVIRETTNSPSNPFLAGSNLADEVELVKFTPIALSLEELSKLWSVFFKIPYTLSVAYQGTVVLIESEDTPRTVLPVRQRNLYVMPFRQPVIEAVTSEAGLNQPIVAGSTLIVRGRQLRGDDTQLRIAGSDVTPGEVTDTRISLPLAEPPLPADALRAGVQGVQVVHRLLLGTPPEPHRGFESNVAPFVLRPTITDVQVANVQDTGNNTRSADVTVTVNPKIGQGQRVALLLNEISDEAPEAYTFSIGPSDADSESITIPVSGVKAADYLVRLQVDGAESILEVDEDPDSPTFNQYIGPKVTIP